MKKYYWDKLTDLEKKNILLRPMITQHENIKNQVRAIIQQVKSEGDQAIIQLTNKFDGVSLADLKVTLEECKTSFTAINSMEFAKKQIETYHQSQLPRNLRVETCQGVFCERQARPIESVGLYIPGGSAPLISTVLMLGVPARIAGCPLRILCTPPKPDGTIDPNLLAAAKLCGIEHVYKIGGAQAIAAMAYGTETIPKVDKIFGPGNAWVTQAKIQISEDPNGANIDMPAGPSELMVIADNNANPAYIAADLLSQAEHGADSQVMLVSLSEVLAAKVESCIEEQLQHLSRKKLIIHSLNNSRIIITDTMNEAIDISNAYAPEHLSLQIDGPDHFIKDIKNAGAVFLGQWTPETAGDYVTGSNHVLPTYGYARSYSGLSVTDFMKFISFQKVSKQGLEKIGPYAEKLAALEGLDAHKQAVSLRLNERVTINE